MKRLRFSKDISDDQYRNADESSERLEGPYERLGDFGCFFNGRRAFAVLHMMQVSGQVYRSRYARSLSWILPILKAVIGQPTLQPGVTIKGIAAYTRKLDIDSGWAHPPRRENVSSSMSTPESVA
jgi:hypothetical protein